MGRSGWVAIVGRPNAGKSTLLNRVVGSRLSIVTPKAQTTRQRVTGILTDQEKGQLVFVDTPGIHRARVGGLNAYMVDVAREAAGGTDLSWYLVDPSSAVHHERPVVELLASAGGPVIVVWTKSDLRRREPTLRAGLLEQARQSGVRLESSLEISASRSLGIDELLEATWQRVPEGPIHYPDPELLSDRPLRFFVGEAVREQLFRQLGEELPYGCAVEIEKFDEAAKPVRVEAVIHVERDSQKGMVIGARGAKIKSIGQAARGQVEKLVGRQVFLGLRVSVLPHWTRDALALRRLGYF